MQKVDAADFFDRTWAEFKAGFGDIGGNYWLGNEQIHQLTNDDGYKLRIDLQVEIGNGQRRWLWAEYSTFIVADEASKYNVTVSGFTGDAGDVLRDVDGRRPEGRRQDEVHDLGPGQRRLPNLKPRSRLPLRILARHRRRRLRAARRRSVLLLLPSVDCSFAHDNQENVAAVQITAFANEILFAHLLVYCLSVNMITQKTIQVLITTL